MLVVVSSDFAAAGDCGPVVGVCDPGWCCSESGWCGQTTDYCKGPQCQLMYSDSCDTYFPPPGESTVDVPRPKIGKVPYGTIINKCVDPGKIALTFDDGPWVYTDMLLDILASYNVKATFFVAGNNLGKGRMDDPTLPHTWTHQDLMMVSSAVQQSEIVYNEIAFRNLFGWFPTYFRCPYLLCDVASGIIPRLDALGYHIIDMNIDTKDYLNDSPGMIQISKDRYSNLVSTIPSQDSYIPLAHDIHYQTVTNLTACMIDTLLARGYTPVTIGECLNDPPANWYRLAGGASSSSSASGSSTSSSVALSSSVSSSTITPTVSSLASSSMSLSTTTSTSRSLTPTSSSSSPSSTLIISTDQTCGGTTGRTCQGSKFGNCCSYFGYCGSTTAYCGTGCQSSYGLCT
ncbi:polysaccharide deacetylase [Leptodontidium sp. MPI-SDFR-AT-0119]|nr:polysaccharide deacetylase [Leptodontidium sp. MPI-SDFR-AT-0119]